MIARRWGEAEEVGVAEAVDGQSRTAESLRIPDVIALEPLTADEFLERTDAQTPVEGLGHVEAPASGSLTGISAAKWLQLDCCDKCPNSFRLRERASERHHPVQVGPTETPAERPPQLSRQRGDNLLVPGAEQAPAA